MARIQPLYAAVSEHIADVEDPILVDSEEADAPLYSDSLPDGQVASSEAAPSSRTYRYARGYLFGLAVGFVLLVALSTARTRRSHMRDGAPGASIVLQAATAASATAATAASQSAAAATSPSLADLLNNPPTADDMFAMMQQSADQQFSEMMPSMDQMGNDLFAGAQSDMNQFANSMFSDASTQMQTSLQQSAKEIMSGNNQDFNNFLQSMGMDSPTAVPSLGATKSGTAAVLSSTTAPSTAATSTSFCFQADNVTNCWSAKPVGAPPCTPASGTTPCACTAPNTTVECFVDGLQSVPPATGRCIQKTVYLSGGQAPTSTLPSATFTGTGLEMYCFNMVLEDQWSSQGLTQPANDPPTNSDNEFMCTMSPDHTWINNGCQREIRYLGETCGGELTCSGDSGDEGMFQNLPSLSSLFGTEETDPDPNYKIICSSAGICTPEIFEASENTCTCNPTQGVPTPNVQMCYGLDPSCSGTCILWPNPSRGYYCDPGASFTAGAAPPVPSQATITTALPGTLTIVTTVAPYTGGGNSNSEFRAPNSDGVQQPR